MQLIKEDIWRIGNVAAPYADRTGVSFPVYVRQEGMALILLREVLKLFGDFSVVDVDRQSGDGPDMVTILHTDLPESALDEVPSPFMVKEKAADGARPLKDCLAGMDVVDTEGLGKLFYFKTDNCFVLEKNMLAWVFSDGFIGFDSGGLDHKRQMESKGFTVVRLYPDVKEHAAELKKICDWYGFEQKNIL